MPEDTKRGRGRPKKDKRQSSFDDAVIEDLDIEDLLEDIEKGEVVAIRVRQAKRELKKLVEAGYADVINAADDGEHSGYVRCGRYRFWAGKTTTPERDQKAKKIPSRESWQPLDVHRLDLFTAAQLGMGGGGE